MTQQPPNSPSSKSPSGSKNIRSAKLQQTVNELENAFSDWNSLPTHPVPLKEPAPEATKSEAELREKTKQLLIELRRQLEELGSDEE